MVNSSSSTRLSFLGPNRLRSSPHERATLGHYTTNVTGVHTLPPSLTLTSCVLEQTALGDGEAVARPEHGQQDYGVGIGLPAVPQGANR